LGLALGEEVGSVLRLGDPAMPISSVVSTKDYYRLAALVYK